MAFYMPDLEKLAATVGDYPNVYEEARGRRMRKETLADLDVKDSASMRAAASKLIATGNKDNVETGIRLLHQADTYDTTKATVAEKSAYTSPGAQPAIDEYERTRRPPPYAPTAPTAPAPAPGLPSPPGGFGGPVPTPDQRSELPPSNPSQIAAAMSPATQGMAGIAGLQPGGLSRPPGPISGMGGTDVLGQAGGAGDVGVLGGGPSPLPSWAADPRTMGRTISPDFPTPPRPEAPSVSTGSPGEASTTRRMTAEDIYDKEDEVRDRLGKVRNILRQLHPRSPMRQVYQNEQVTLLNILEKIRTDPETMRWERDQRFRAQQGLPIESPEEHKARVTLENDPEYRKYLAVQEGKKKAGEPTERFDQYKARMALETDPEYRRLQESNKERARAGLPPQTMEEAGFEKATQVQRDARVAKIAEPIREDATKGQAIKNTLSTMENILRDPRFFSGENADKFRQNVSSFASFLRKAEVITGADLSKWIGMVTSFPDRLKDTAALQEMFRGLQNQIIVSSLNLGRSTDKDVAVHQSVGPALATTEVGNQLLMEYHKAKVDNAIKLHEFVADWRDKHPMAGDAQLDLAIRKWHNDNSLLTTKDGYTPLGTKMLKEAARAREGGGTPAPPAAGPPVRGALAPPTGGTAINPADEGRTGTMPDGTKFIIRGGRPVPVETAPKAQPGVL